MHSQFERLRVVVFGEVIGWGLLPFNSLGAHVTCRTRNCSCKRPSSLSLGRALAAEFESFGQTTSTSMNEKSWLTGSNSENRESPYAVVWSRTLSALCYREISESTARAIATHVLNKDLAYQVEVIPSDEARELVSQFFELCCTPDWRFFSNGDFSLKASSSWTPATESTFDTGVLMVAGDRSGCLWVEDED